MHEMTWKKFKKEKNKKINDDDVISYIDISFDLLAGEFEFFIDEDKRFVEIWN